MAEAARRLRTNRRLEGSECGWTGDKLVIGEEAVVCNGCEAAYKAAAWDEHNGCATSDCVYAAVAEIDDGKAKKEAATGKSVADSFFDKPANPPGYMNCPSCGHLVPERAEICPLCDHILAADGIYRGPKETAPGAVAALVLGIVGLFICGFILGAIAIAQSQKAKANIAMNPRYGGEGMATAGFVLGIIGIVGHLIILILRFSVGF